MDDKKELRKANGDVYFEAYRAPRSSYIHVNWIGVQTLETVVMGGNTLLEMLRQRHCRGMLNCNKELVGPWDVGVPYLVHKWVPAASMLGMRYFAHVMSPGIFGQRSFELLRQNVKDHFEYSQFHIKSFEEEDMAEAWLQLHLV